MNVPSPIPKGLFAWEQKYVYVLFALSMATWLFASIQSWILNKRSNFAKNKTVILGIILSFFVTLIMSFFYSFDIGCTFGKRCKNWALIKSAVVVLPFIVVMFALIFTLFSSSKEDVPEGDALIEDEK